MMKRFVFLFFGLWTFIPVFAQTEQQKMEADPDLAKGIYYIHSFDKGPETPAPKGYKPFVISHYARHGARYQGGEGDYTRPLEKLREASDAHALNELGESVYSRLSDYYALCKNRHGDLTRLGWKQHRKIAAQMYDGYPEIFKHNPEITASSSLVMRSVMSMVSFCMSLKEKNPRLDITEDATRVLLDASNPSDKSNPNLAPYDTIPTPWTISCRQFRKNRIPEENARAIVARMFRDSVYLQTHVNVTSLASELYNVIIGMDCNESGIRIDDLFTPEELLPYYDVLNSYFFEWASIHRNGYLPILKDMVSRAGEDIRGDRPAVRLRFGHDINLLAVLTLLQVERMGIMPDRPEDICLTWNSWRTPMAATFELVFYRSRKDPRILFKGILNGEEISIQSLTPVSGPYYDYEDLARYVATL